MSLSCALMWSNMGTKLIIKINGSPTNWFEKMETKAKGHCEGGTTEAIFHLERRLHAGRLLRSPPPIPSLSRNDFPFSIFSNQFSTDPVMPVRKNIRIFPMYLTFFTGLSTRESPPEEHIPAQIVRNI